MYSFVYQIYFILKRIEKRRKEQKKVSSRLVTFLLGHLEAYYNVFWKRWIISHPSTQNYLNKKPRREKIVVSLTTYPGRIDTIWMTIETLLRQSVKPDAVILWLAKEQFDGLNSLPESLLRLQAKGLTIRFCDDLRSHKKYYYALQECQHDLVVLADDDMFYPRDTIQKLLRLHKQNPKDICCMTGQVIELEESTLPSQWRNPLLRETHWQHTDKIQVFTGSGTLIPPQALPEEAFNRENIRKLCLHADDLWITFMAHRNGTKVSTLRHWRAFPVTIYGTEVGSLYYINAGEGENQNDVQWQKLLDYYGETLC